MNRCLSNASTIVYFQLMPRTDIIAVIQTLELHYGTLQRIPTVDPFELILWENVAYLASPALRATAFQMLKREVGTSPQEILDAPLSALLQVTAHGILKEKFAAKLRTCAEIALRSFDGNLLRAILGPVPKAKQALRLFPGIGEPGAEKILLLSHTRPFLAPDSNALRVLARLGFIEDDKSYSRMYRASREVERTIGPDIEKLQRAHELLQHHGQVLCKRTAPACRLCPLAGSCAWLHGRRD
jgi:endonuclease III